MDRQVQRSDAELVESACDGDVESFRSLYEKHYRLAVGIAYSRLRDVHLAEDAAQETFAIACQRIHTLRRGERFPEWLGTICRRVANKILSRQTKHDPLQDRPCCDNAPDSNSDLALRQAIERLPHASKEVVTLHYFSGLSYQEIALALGITPANVHGRLQRARKKLAYYLSQSI